MMKMKRRTQEIALDGDYEGFVFEANLAVPMWVMTHVQSGRWELIQAALKEIVISWNFVDYDGNPLPQPHDTFTAKDPLGNVVMTDTTETDKDGKLLTDEEGEVLQVPMMVSGITVIPTDLGMAMLNKVAEAQGVISTP